MEYIVQDLITDLVPFVVSRLNFIRRKILSDAVLKNVLKSYLEEVDPEI